MPTRTEPVYKLLAAREWADARARGRFDGSAVDVRDGYIHLSARDQVVETAARHFAGATDLVLLTVDPLRLGDTLRWEASRGGALFPHVYGPLPLDAVTAVGALRAGVPVPEAVARVLARPRLPVLTLVATGLALVAAIVQYAVPGAVPALERDPVALAHGQWWRTASPLLVQTLGWYQVLTNLVTLALVGAVAEIVLGRRRWLAFLAVGTVAGEIAAYAWHEPGGGDSIAICGLAGGAAIAMLAARTPVPRYLAQPVVYYVAALTGWGLFGLKGAGAAVLVTGVLLVARVPQRLALAGTVPAAVLLAGVRDLHGVSLAAAMAVMAVLVIPGYTRWREDGDISTR